MIHLYSFISCLFAKQQNEKEKEKKKKDELHQVKPVQASNHGKGMFDLRSSSSLVQSVILKH